MPSPPTDCRCGSTGSYVVNIALADAVVSERRLCLTHGLTPRTRLFDTTTGRVGELMDVSVTNHRAWLRPVGGGKEWSTSVDSLRPAPPTITNEGDTCTDG